MPIIETVTNCTPEAPACEHETGVISPAMLAVLDHVTDVDTFIPLRVRLGDCAAGAYAAGATEEQAVLVAQRCHTSNRTNRKLWDRLCTAGGLIVGAEEYLKEVNNA